MREANQFNFSIENINEEHFTTDPQLLLQHISSQELSRFKEYLFDSLSTKDGAPTFSNLALKNFTYNAEDKKGRFRISFDIERAYCCSDTESCNSDYADFDFQYTEPRIVANTQYFVWELNN